MDVLKMQSWAFMAKIPDDISPIRDLLIGYSKLSPEEVDAHLHRTRENAWGFLRTPFIGRWKFLNLTDSNDPCYLQVLFRLNLTHSQDSFLDLGCGFGQALRQLRFDGVDGAKLFGFDSNASLIAAGYDLFKDKGTFGASFVIGDIVDPNDSGFQKLNGKISIIHAGSFFHLFSWTQQLYIGKRIVGFLRPGTPNALIYGRHAGTSLPKEVQPGSSSPYIHNAESFQRLWDEIGELTETSWKVEIQSADREVDQLPGTPRGVRAVNFTVYQLPWHGYRALKYA